jgi:carbon-monoxide dehydrogenase medium subunit
MKPAPFEYVAPKTLDEALIVMDENGFNAKLLDGGQSLIAAMNFRLAQPSLLVDLNGVEELSKLHPDESHGVRIGAMVRHSQLEHSPVIHELSPLIHQVMPHIAHPQIRNRGTVGGSLAHADPAAELPVVMIALQAGFRLRSLGGQRWVNAKDFFESLFTTVLQPEEILVDVAVPPKRPNTGYAFLELARRHGDYAQAGVAAVVSLDEQGRCREVHLVYLNAGDVPMVASQAAAMLIGQEPAADLVEEAAYVASRQEIAPTTDIHDSAEYKRHLAFVLGKRAITQAVDGARAGTLS